MGNLEVEYPGREWVERKSKDEASRIVLAEVERGEAIAVACIVFDSWFLKAAVVYYSFLLRISFLSVCPTSSEGLECIHPLQEYSNFIRRVRTHPSTQRIL